MTSNFSYDHNYVYGANSNYLFGSSRRSSMNASKSSTGFSSRINSQSFWNYSSPSPPRESITFGSNSKAQTVRPSMRDRSRNTPHMPTSKNIPRTNYESRYLTSKRGIKENLSTIEQNELSKSNGFKLSIQLQNRRSSEKLPSLPRDSPISGINVSTKKEEITRSPEKPLPLSRDSPISRYKISTKKEEITRSTEKPPALFRDSPISRVKISSKKEEITIDNPPYRTSYQPSFSKESPKRQTDNFDKASSLTDYNNPVGLKNIGNTCFMNSMLQCLSHTSKLRKYCLDSEYQSQINNRSPMKGKLIKAFAEVIKDLWSGNGSSVTPSNFKTQIQRFSPRFVGYEQQDSQEFLRFLLEGLHEDINQVQVKSSEPMKDLSRLGLRPHEIAQETWKWYGKKDKSFVFDLFVGQLESYLQCNECGHISLTYDPFWDLSLPISKSSNAMEPTSLYDCLRNFTKEETLDRDEKPMCEKCKVRRSMKKKLSIHRFPKILVIHLKRFHEGSRYRQKLSNLVVFPVEDPLDLGSFASETSADGPSTSYDLYAVSNHCGSCYGGHYTACCRNFSTARWYEFNDSRVTLINEAAVCTKEAYVLFYVQKASSPGRFSRL